MEFNADSKGRCEIFDGPTGTVLRFNFEEKFLEIPNDWKAINFCPFIQIQQFVDDNRKWTDEKFGNMTPVSVLSHLRKEVGEASDAIANNEGEEAVKMEFADMYLLLLNAASRQGISFTELHNTAVQKMAINRERKWGNPNPEGFVEHVEEPVNFDNFRGQVLARRNLNLLGEIPKIKE